MDLLIIWLGEIAMPHASDVAARAAHEIHHGRYRVLFWVGAIGVGHVVPLALAATGQPVLLALGGLLAIVGLYCFEHAFVMAPQRIRNS